MPEKNLEPFVEFLNARAQFDKDLMKLISEFEGRYSCRVTAVDAGDFVRSEGKWYRSQPIRTTVEV